MTAVEIQSITKTYPKNAQPVLKDFSLSVAPGELVTLLGPSGSGKSTLLKLITGIEQPDHGDIKFDGKSILGITPNRRGAVLMFQKAYLFPFLSVLDNIGFGLKVQGASKQTIQTEVSRMLELIGLSGFERRKPAQLSGGEQQRVALARALITRPRLMLLDEPLSSLDTEVRSGLQEAIRRIQTELGLTTILVTHDLSEAMSMSDRTALLFDGSIVALDSPARLFQHPRSRAAARFVGVTTFLEGTLEKDDLVTEGGTLQVRSNGAPPGPALFAIRPEHIRIQSRPGENTLIGVVKDCMYRGEYVEYQIMVGKMNVRARLPMPARMVPEGQKVHVEFPPEHLFEMIEEPGYCGERLEITRGGLVHSRQTASQR